MILKSNPSHKKIFLNGVQSEIKDPGNRNKARPNLPKDEAKALVELVRLQRERVIVIKPADKGSGIVILDFADYLTSCNNHLQSQQKQPDGSWKNYYSSVTEDDFKAAKDEIKGVLDEALKANLITKSDYDQMNPMDKGPSKFYEIFKMHKMKDGMRIPPERPIISGCGSITENIGK